MADKPKVVKPFLVLKRAGDGLFSLEYRGPEKSKAREKVEKLLRDKDAMVLVVRGTVNVLQPGDLAASLPRDAF